MTFSLHSKCRPEKKAFARKMRKQMTPAEQALADVVKGDALGVRVRRQYVMRGYILDFYIPAWGLVIEMDGKHHSAGEQLAHDQKRDAVLRGLGLNILRYDNALALRDMDFVVSQIKSKARQFSLRNMVIAERGFSNRYNKLRGKPKGYTSAAPVPSPTAQPASKPQAQRTE